MFEQIDTYQHLDYGTISVLEEWTLKVINSKITSKYLKQKLTFYHVQVNMQVRLTLRFLQISPVQLLQHGDHFTMLLYRRTWLYFINLVVEDPHWIFAHNQQIKRLWAHHDSRLRKKTGKSSVRPSLTRFS